MWFISIIMFCCTLFDSDTSTQASYAQPQTSYLSEKWVVLIKSNQDISVHPFICIYIHLSFRRSSHISKQFCVSYSIGKEGKSRSLTCICRLIDVWLNRGIKLWIQLVVIISFPSVVKSFISYKCVNPYYLVYYVIFRQTFHFIDFSNCISW